MQFVRIVPVGDLARSLEIVDFWFLGRANRSLYWRLLVDISWMLATWLTPLQLARSTSGASSCWTGSGSLADSPATSHSQVIIITASKALPEINIIIINEKLKLVHRNDDHDQLKGPQVPDRLPPPRVGEEHQAAEGSSR